MNTVYLALGSNMHRHKSLHAALEYIAKSADIEKASHVYESIPLHAKGPNFYNMVIKVSTCYSLKMFYDLTKDIEAVMGRDNCVDSLGNTQSIRCLDIDILLFNNVTRKTNPQLPREDIFKYDFVVVPLYEISPDLIIESAQTNIAQIYETFKEHNLKVVADF